MERGLASYAAQTGQSRGRRHFESEPTGGRSEYQRDRDRVIHSTAFRRLEYKTQVFVNHEGDLYRTRLTHSLEVGQVGRAIARQLGLDEDLVEAISLAHDLGHTPFGHAGQDALNACMAEYGGFEHNIQSLRVVDVLEMRYGDFPGLNLTFETREGILKHCSRNRAEKLGDVGERFLKGEQPSLEAQITNLADEIAYNNHDIDDGLRAGLLNLDALVEETMFGPIYREVAQRYPTASRTVLRHEAGRRLINLLITDLVEHTSSRISAAGIQSPADVRQCSEPLAAHSPDRVRAIRSLKSFLMQNLYRHPQVHRQAEKAKRTVRQIFELLFTDPQLLPRKQQGFLREHPGDLRRRARVVADYIAGMTDRFAIAEHERLFNPRSGA
ncbi:deoxyguanosinetriphosphate triphosphohydrolase [Acidithiobacillus sp. CV18-2]|uniref:Deoxyguanosinetriphosphate triphosphohydrolase-like protein n=1 Tax=Igneacidithiobacillus copahuensis TaxID=2724909 RepID=A0AAE3CKL2_9PROT|nr:deoxyguanosinetriphosphate triphosphohydrolase [Igneacidithiobacillus copahuensis]MBU2754860.1 deoxyguanosinetriphosphate triphosphohydrolase [Acidithiobacillus sp. CV18-3]MBU2756742.1 deoxyguanosinetriphosphate triphosphohydrolase [Acidithiobacillus sp. BN09-2]MBU2777153.1 deoxyguanosinetriphosphate triphosphohydrolase [Acidithiobacillus sp. CV18-2]MBU2795613.1 deoxyguanosinetriphosphate triphosphohydrolase [Acidithiobacillus sp. VAN18-2]MBU2799056.1 deoxyguanosinetriphosphate triphosphohy